MYEHQFLVRQSDNIIFDFLNIIFTPDIYNQEMETKKGKKKQSKMELQWETVHPYSQIYNQ